jgi:hypothetical protein
MRNARNAVPIIVVGPSMLFLRIAREDVGGRAKPGHDGGAKELA